MRTLLLLGWFAGAPLCGQTAPPLVLERTIPAGVEIARDRPMVLEFWATWCANCLAEIPHWNALAAKFPGIQFVSISDEAAPVVERFLASQPIRGVVAIDRGGATFRDYGVDGRPLTVLIDRAGVERARVHPGQVSEATLADLEAGREVKPAGLPGRLQIVEDAAGGDPVFALMLRASANPKSAAVIGLNPGKIEGTNVALRLMLSYAYEISEDLIDGPQALLSARYDFCVLLPDGVTGDVGLFREMLERSFRLKIRRQSRPREVAVLKSSRPLEGPHPMASLARVLEYRLKRPVLNETGADSYRHFQLPGDNAQMLEELRTRLGIEVSYERREIETLAVDALELPAFRMRVRAQR